MRVMSQLRLFAPPSFNPTSGGVRHYVVALQSRIGELDALRALPDSAWERLTPLIQVVGRRTAGPTTRSTVRQWARRVAPAVGTHPCFLDTLGSPANRSSILAILYEESRRAYINFVPVLRVGESSQRRFRAVTDAATQDGRGVCLRHRVLETLPPPGSNVKDLLQATLEALDVRIGEADLILDLGFLDPDYPPDIDLERIVNDSTSVGIWRSLVLLGTSMPRSLGRVPQGSDGYIARREWEGWVALKETLVTRLPTFGDYAIQNPEPPGTGGGIMRANIRYTLENATLVVRGRPVFEGKGQYRDLCERIVKHPRFAGSRYSWGDEILMRCADGLVPPGSQSMWRGAGTSHHLRVVDDQLQGAAPGS